MISVASGVFAGLSTDLSDILLAGALLLFPVSQIASGQADASTSDSAIALARGTARGKLEKDQEAIYAQPGRKPKSYSQEELERLGRDADERVLAALSRFPHASDEDVERIRTKLVEARKALAGTELPTKSEDPLIYRTLQIVLNQVWNGVDEFQKSHPDKPRLLPQMRQIVFGTLPSVNVNAETTLINPEEEDKSRRVYLVEINSGLLRFAEVFSEMLAKISAPSGPEGKFLTLSLKRDDVDKYLQSHPETTDEFNKLMRAYLLRGGPFLVSEFQTKEPEEPYATFASMIYRSILVYALSHELGHVIHDQNDLWKTDNKELPEGWSEEYSADGWGVTLSLMAGGHNTNLEATVLGARQYFACYDLIERGISMITTGEEFYRASTSHPPANKRKERITRYVLSALRSFWNREPSSIKDFNQLKESSESLELAAEALWVRGKPGLIGLYKQKERLAQDWNILIPAQAH